MCGYRRGTTCGCPLRIESRGTQRGRPRAQGGWRGLLRARHRPVPPGAVSRRERRSGREGAPAHGPGELVDGHLDPGPGGAAAQACGLSPAAGVLAARGPMWSTALGSGGGGVRRLRPTTVRQGPCTADLLVAAECVPVRSTAVPGPETTGQSWRLDGHGRTSRPPAAGSGGVGSAVIQAASGGGPRTEDEERAAPGPRPHGGWEQSASSSGARRTWRCIDGPSRQGSRRGRPREWGGYGAGAAAGPTTVWSAGLGFAGPFPEAVALTMPRHAEKLLPVGARDAAGAVPVLRGQP